MLSRGNAGLRSERKFEGRLRIKFWATLANLSIHFDNIGIFARSMLSNNMQLLKTIGTGDSRFDISQPAVARRADEIVTKVKHFVRVVASCDLIVNTLPKLNKSQHAQKITDHLASLTTTGSVLPTNLRSFLTAELKKAHKSR